LFTKKRPKNWFLKKGFKCNGYPKTENLYFGISQAKREDILKLK
jgi:hypothetical protein